MPNCPPCPSLIFVPKCSLVTDCQGICSVFLMLSPLYTAPAVFLSMKGTWLGLWTAPEIVIMCLLLMGWR